MAENEPASQSQADQLSRRRALKILVGTVSAATSLPVMGEGAPGSGSVCHVASRAAERTAYQAKCFGPEEIRIVEALSETLIPADDHSPGAKAARVWEYIDEIVADADKATKHLWREGLALLNGSAERKHGRNFEDCTAHQQVSLVEQISRNEEHPIRLEDRFFITAKRATIDGYYTSAIGIHQDLQYQGNTALAEFPGCTHPEHNI